jgi:hypothetical protein
MIARNRTTVACLTQKQKKTAGGQERKRVTRQAKITLKGLYGAAAVPSMPGPVAKMAVHSARQPPGPKRGSLGFIGSTCVIMGKIKGKEECLI